MAEPAFILPLRGGTLEFPAGLGELSDLAKHIAGYVCARESHRRENFVRKPMRTASSCYFLFGRRSQSDSDNWCANAAFVRCMGAENVV